jgi:hypothetical protein
MRVYSALEAIMAVSIVALVTVGFVFTMIQTLPPTPLAS